MLFAPAGNAAGGAVRISVCSVARLVFSARAARGDPEPDHRVDRVALGGGEGHLVGGDRAAVLGLP